MALKSACQTGNEADFLIWSQLFSFDTEDINRY